MDYFPDLHNSEPKMRPSIHTADYYTTNRQRFSVLSVGLARRTALIERFISDGDVVLDIGAADGAMMRDIASRKKIHWFGFEENRELALCDSHLICGDFRKSGLPFPDGSFSVATCSATRKHIPDSLRLAQEIHRVLEPGGIAIMLDPHPLYIRFGLLIGKFDRRWLHHIDSAKTIQAEMQSVGMEPVHRSTGLFVLSVSTRPH
jgi:SAM-dependent methyltransferase